MAGHAARLLSAHYAIALSRLPSPRATAASDSEPCPYAALSARLKPLAVITRTVCALRRGEHESARMKMKQQVIAFASGAQPAAESKGHFPAVPVSPRSRVPNHADPEHQAKSRFWIFQEGPRRRFHFHPQATPPKRANQTKSNQIKPCNLQFTSQAQPRANGWQGLGGAQSRGQPNAASRLLKPNQTKSRLRKSSLIPLTLPHDSRFPRFTIHNSRPASHPHPVCNSRSPCRTPVMLLLAD
jgi:hypothetical protein